MITTETIRRVWDDDEGDAPFEIKPAWRAGKPLVRVLVGESPMAVDFTPEQARAVAFAMLACADEIIEARTVNGAARPVSDKGEE